MKDYNKIALHAAERRNAILAELDHLDKLLETVVALADLQSLPNPEMVRKMPPVRVRTAQVMNPTREAATRHLRANGFPMATKDLVPLLESDGVTVGGKDKVATLSARLSNSDEFKNIRGLGWWFAGENLPNLPGVDSIFSGTEGGTVTSETSPSVPEPAEGRVAGPGGGP